MENAFILTLLSYFKQVGWQIVMFILCGVAFELLLEFVKATLYPKDKDGNAKACPRWLGLLMGAIITAIYLFLAYAAFFAYGKDGGFYIPGGLVFIPVWAILFFFYQYKAVSISKWLCSKLFPSLKNPFYERPKREKKVKEKDLSKEEIDKLILDLREKKKALE